MSASPAARDKDFVDLGILAKHLEITDPAELVRIAYAVDGEFAVKTVPNATVSLAA